MDAKITPEQAIELLNEIRTIENINGYTYKQVELSPEEAAQIAALLESLSREAELGRAAVEAIGNKSPYPCQYPFFIDGSSICKMCTWTNFCRLRAESGNLNAEQQQPSGIELIAAERQRQISQEGWTPEHDDQHANGELALAAACYAIPSHRRIWDELISKLWPWALKWWKPTPEDRKRELVKSCALILAEIDRIDRLQQKGAE